MKHTVSDRGFKFMRPFSCTYGSKVEVYESSAASAPHIWLKIESNIKALASLERGEAVAHLSIGQAKILKEQLEWLIEHHYQVEESE